MQTLNSLTKFQAPSVSGLRGKPRQDVYKHILEWVTAYTQKYGILTITPNTVHVFDLICSG